MSKIASFDEIVSKYEGDNAVKAAASRTKIKKEAELSGQVSAAKIAKMDAEAALEAAIITDGKSIAQAAAQLEKATRDLEFYQTLYSSVFPNA